MIKENAIDVWGDFIDGKEDFVVGAKIDTTLLSHQIVFYVSLGDKKIR